MLKSLTTSVRQFLTAIVLLVVLLVGTETAMQISSPAVTPKICPHVCDQWQSLLVASPTLHHDNPRLASRTIDGIAYDFNAAGFRQTSFERKPLESSDGAAAGTNELTRGPHTTTSKQQNSTLGLRIVILGDERIFGTGLPAADTVSARLQQFLDPDGSQGIEVTNAAVIGSCPALSLLKYRQDVRPLAPDVVILHLDHSDIADDAAVRRYLKNDASGTVCPHPDLCLAAQKSHPVTRLFSNFKLTEAIRSEFASKSSRSISQTLPARYQWTFHQTMADVGATEIRQALSPIEDLVQETQATGAVFLLSSSPLPWQIADASEFPDLRLLIPTGQWKRSGSAGEVMASVAARLQISLCSAEDSFRRFSQSQKLFQPGSVNLSRLGAALYAREIARALVHETQFQQLVRMRADQASSQRSSGVDRWPESSGQLRH